MRLLSPDGVERGGCRVGGVRVSRRGWVGTRWAGICLVAVMVTAVQAAPAGAKDQGSDAKISSSLFALARSHPKDGLAVIVRAAAGDNAAHNPERAAAAVRRAHGKVGRSLSIVGGASATLTGDKVLA